jgi:hypothetical protein
VDRETQGDFEVAGSSGSEESRGGRRSTGGGGVNTDEDLLFGVEREVFSQLSARKCGGSVMGKNHGDLVFSNNKLQIDHLSNKNQDETIRQIWNTIDHIPSAFLHKQTTQYFNGFSIARLSFTSQQDRDRARQ